MVRAHWVAHAVQAAMQAGAEGRNAANPLHAAEGKLTKPAPGVSCDSCRAGPVSVQTQSSGLCSTWKITRADRVSSDLRCILGLSHQEFSVAGPVAGRHPMQQAA